MTQVEITDAEFLRDLAGRIFRNAAPTMGFDQGDTDRLYMIASTLPAAPYPDTIGSNFGNGGTFDPTASSQD